MVTGHVNQVVVANMARGPAIAKEAIRHITLFTINKIRSILILFYYM